MFYEPKDVYKAFQIDPFKALVAPRPIGWISTISSTGSVNLAPYSFFNATGEDPPTVFFSSAGEKDSCRNAESTREFVCSLATYDLREAMNISSASVPSDVDEMALAKLTPAASRLVKPPRVAESPVAFECRYLQTVQMPGVYRMVIGEVVGVYVDDRFIVSGRVNTSALRPIARLGYSEYAVVTPETTFRIRRPA